MTQAKLNHFMKDIHISYCSCSKYFEKNKWKPYNTIKDLVCKRIREKYPRAKLVFEDFEFPDKPKHKVVNEVGVKTKGKEHVVKVFLRLSKCNICEKEGTEYYEAILQVRCPNIRVLEESVELLKQRIDNLRHKGVFINKVKSVNQGYDLYITNKRVAMSLGRELYNAYGGIYKASPHLFSRSRQTSKNIYRVNIVVKLPGFEKGDFVLDDKDRVYKVKNVGKKIKLLDLEKNSFVNVDYKKFKYHILRTHKTYVSKLVPVFEVLHPFDFQSTLVKNKPEQRPELGDEVEVVVHKGVYVVG
ncbi:hypothetical protein KY348_07640 [Candidatus Woesearchaeota archaeon]|nr:hypothetical protein [Candidatus Woesearchaeota archaeon]